MTEKQNLLKVTHTQKRALAIATIAAAVAGVLFLKNYFMLIAIAAIVAFLFQPVYQWLLLKRLKPGTATAITFFTTLLFIIIPIGLVMVVMIAQVAHIVDAARTSTIDIDFGELGRTTVDIVNNTLANFGLNHRVTEQSITSAITSAVELIGSSVLSSIASSVTGVFGLITSLVIYVFVFFSILRNQDKITNTVGVINPLGEKITDVYFRRMGSMTKAMVRGQFIIAILQGTASAIVLSIAGMSDLFFFFLLVLSVMSIIPLGAGIITIPIGMIMILFGNVWQGVMVILNHLLIVTNIDNVLKPYLVPKDAKLDPALTMLSVFSGMAAFGFVGIVLGPVLMIVIVTTIQMFLEVYRDVDALGDTTQPVKHQSLWRKIATSRR